MSRRYLTTTALGELDSQLTDHDRRLLRSVSDLRFVRGDHVARLYFGDDQADARAARRALLRLAKLDVLARLPRVIGGVRRGSQGFVYRLGPAGQGLAIRYGWQPPRRYQAHVPGTLFLRHALQVAELHTVLTELDRHGRIELLELVAEPACWRIYGDGQSRVSLKPDSYVRLGVGEYEDSYFIEVDMGTEGSRAIDNKLEAYLAYYRSGLEQREHGVFPSVLWLAPDAERAGVIENGITRLAQDERTLFDAMPFVLASDVFTNTTVSNEH
jgi:hypothetical protein